MLYALFVVYPTRTLKWTLLDEATWQVFVWQGHVFGPHSSEKLNIHNLSLSNIEHVNLIQFQPN